MGIRQSINENPAITTGVAAGIIAIALGFIVWQSCGGTGDPGAGPGAVKQFFTTDDGATYFPEDGSKIPPFQTADGKTAVRARVFRCPDGKEFVNHLERFGAEDKKKLEDAMSNAKDKGGGIMALEFMGGGAMEVKKPKDKEWTKIGPKTVDKYQKIITPVCADGSSKDIQLVLPK